MKENLIKKINDGNTTIEIYSSDLSIEEQQENLFNIYKTINRIAKNQKEKGNKIDKWFYTKNELKNIKI